MHRDGIDHDNVEPKDILCDFCGAAAWAAGDPCVEGHKGSIICGSCLAIAFQDISNEKNECTTDEPCRMCLELREQSTWLGSVEPIASICLRCVKQSAQVLEKSNDWTWVKPTVN